MRLPVRFLLLSAVLVALAAGTAAAFTLSAARDRVALPEFATTGVTEPEPPQPLTTGAPVSGPQIVAQTVVPARQRAEALVAEQQRRQQEQQQAAAAAAAAEEQRARDAARAEPDKRTSRRQQDPWDRFREQIREACQDGRLRGSICH